MNYLPFIFLYTNKQEKEIYAYTILVLVGFILLFLWNWIQKIRFKRNFKKALKAKNIAIEKVKTFENSLAESNKNAIVLETKINSLNIDIKENKKLLIDKKQLFNDKLLSQKKKYEEELNNLSYANSFYVNAHEDIKDKSKHIEVQAINTRLGAHFLKNVLTKIYIEHKNQETGAINAIKKFFVINNVKKELLPIDILKKINILLDYNVSTLYDKKINLSEEVEKVNLFLDVFKFLKPKVVITTEFEENYPNLQISPTLLFPFLENALKHGVYDDDGCILNIKLMHIDNSIMYEVSNTIDQEVELSEKGGFGLKALDKSLKFYYKNSELKNWFESKKHYSLLKVTIE